MTDWLRRAGRGRDAEGWWVVWSVAEGGRGRRWREVRSRDGSVASSLLLETDPDGRFNHLELSTSSGLLTLHPESDGTLHGNAVTADGVEHIRGLAWTPDGLVLLDGSAICRAVAADLMGRAAAASTSAALPGLRIALSLEVEAVEVGVETLLLDLDEQGLPVLDEGQTWPMEA